MSTLYADQCGYLALFSAVQPPERAGGLRSPRSAYFAYPRRTEEALAWARENIAEDREVHLCPHLLTKRRRVKENASPVRALWADADDAVLPADIPEPTVVVESSPGRRHLYWALRHTLAPRSAEALNRRLTYASGADPAGWPLATLLRMPGTHNHKYSNSPVVEIAQADPTLSYHPRELALCLPDDPSAHTLTEEQLRSVGCASVAEAGDLGSLSERIQALIRGGHAALEGAYRSRSEADFAACIAKFGAGLSEEAVWKVMTDPANGISEKYHEKGRHGAGYLATTIAKAWQLAEPAAPPRASGPEAA